jgi:hypothetical protein
MAGMPIVGLRIYQALIQATAEVESRPMVQ